jgi:hypothetical protein
MLAKWRMQAAGAKKSRVWFPEPSRGKAGLHRSKLTQRKNEFRLLADETVRGIPRSD